MIQFKIKYSLKNGNKLNKKNWHKVIAVATEPNHCNQGWPAIDKIRNEGGEYYDTWKLKKEEEGYIFREITHGGGINGHHKTYRQAIFKALSHRIIISIPE